MIDVKATMDMCRAAVAGGLNRSEVNDLAIAIVELVQSDREYDDAQRQLNDETLTTEEHHATSWPRFHAARDRRAAALSRFGETK